MSYSDFTMPGSFEHIPLKSGENVEGELLDRVIKKNERAQEFYKEKYVPYKEALKDVRLRQPWSPYDPKRPFARDVRLEVIDRLGFTDKAGFEHVGFFTAVGSALDYYHGVDAFLEVALDIDLAKLERTPRESVMRSDYKPGTYVRVTLDVTTREKDADEQKADVVIWVPPDGIDENDVTYLDAVGVAADQIMEKLEGNPGKLLADIHQENHHERQ